MHNGEVRVGFRIEESAFSIFFCGCKLLKSFHILFCGRKVTAKF